VSELEEMGALLAGLPRGGPGSEAATRRALARLAELAPFASPPRVADMGCGPGAQTMVLAAELGRPVAALDLLPAMAAQTAARARARGLAGLVLPVVADMGRPPFAPGSLDLVWAEASIYNLGFGQGLALWRGLLAPGGRVAASELAWLTDRPPAAAAEFWARAYPPMTDRAGGEAQASAAGYRVLDCQMLDDAQWWEEFYHPVEERLQAMAGRLTAVQEALALEFRQEMALRRSCGESYGYIFYLLQREE
jgi:serine/threonine-protein kinase HipA